MFLAEECKCADTSEYSDKILEQPETNSKIKSPERTLNSEANVLPTVYRCNELITQCFPMTIEKTPAKNYPSGSDSAAGKSTRNDSKLEPSKSCTVSVKLGNDSKEPEKPIKYGFCDSPKKGFFNKNQTYELKIKEDITASKKKMLFCEISKRGRKIKSGKFRTRPKTKHSESVEKIDIYYFDHGNSAYYRTTDSPPILKTERCAEITDQAATRFWAEIFGTIHLGTAFATAFVLQFLRFVLYSLVRPLTVGIIQLIGDYFLKPCLSIVFNSFVQPILILLYNIATSLRDLCAPIAGAVGLFLNEIANVFRAIRIVEIRQINPTATST